MEKSVPKSGYPAPERGFVLIIVLLLIILVSGLGLMAVRHSRQEASSTGAYVDSTQAVALVESAMAVAISDLRGSPDYYRERFISPETPDMTDADSDGSADDTETPQQIIGDATDMWRVSYAFPLSNDFYSAGTPDSCDFREGTDCPPGFVPDLSKISGAGPNYRTLLTFDAPMLGPCPPGYSCFDDQNYAWYIFGVNSTVQFGTSYAYWNTRFVETARAQGKGRVTIGPIAAYGN
ncbi:MAG: hypothetical protein JXX14_13125 [Deltaproteobacteria bacterium]|nr:hypothetical protein [Deltaproteobacteria bacterium]